VLHVLYLLFNEGYASSSGPDLAREDLSGEAIRLTRAVRDALPDEPEVGGLLALMLLNDARRGARTDDAGDLVPLAVQDRTRWDRSRITEGTVLLTDSLRARRPGEYQVQAAIAAVHDQAPSHEDTPWDEILSLYALLGTMTDNPMVTLNHAVAASMVHGPEAGLAMLDGLEQRLGDHHRLHAVRAHLREQHGDVDGAIEAFRSAAARTDNARERHYLSLQAARLAHGR
jgi:predicted RNA polymerase sigma factor